MQPCGGTKRRVLVLFGMMDTDNYAGRDVAIDKLHSCREQIATQFLNDSLIQAVLELAGEVE